MTKIYLQVICAQYLRGRGRGVARGLEARLQLRHLGGELGRLTRPRVVGRVDLLLELLPEPLQLSRVALRRCLELLLRLAIQCALRLLERVLPLLRLRFQLRPQPLDLAQCFVRRGAARREILLQLLTYIIGDLETMHD